MAKPNREGKKRGKSDFWSLLRSSECEDDKKPGAEKPSPPDPKPSLETIGLSDCSVCGTEVSVVLTRAGHPFTACGKCGARTFYNSRIAIEILKRKLRELDHE